MCTVTTVTYWCSTLAVTSQKVRTYNTYPCSYLSGAFALKSFRNVLYSPPLTSPGFIGIDLCHAAIALNPSSCPSIGAASNKPATQSRRNKLDFSLIDLKSSKSTKLNGKIIQSGICVALKAGDKFSLGESSKVFRLVRGMAAPSEKKSFAASVTRVEDPLDVHEDSSLALSQPETVTENAAQDDSSSSSGSSSNIEARIISSIDVVNNRNMVAETDDRHYNSNIIDYNVDNSNKRDVSSSNHGNSEGSNHRDSNYNNNSHGNGKNDASDSNNTSHYGGGSSNSSSANNNNNRNNNNSSNSESNSHNSQNQNNKYGKPQRDTNQKNVVAKTAVKAESAEVKDAILRENTYIDKYGNIKFIARDGNNDMSDRNGNTVKERIRDLPVRVDRKEDRGNNWNNKESRDRDRGRSRSRSQSVKRTDSRAGSRDKGRKKNWSHSRSADRSRDRSGPKNKNSINRNNNSGRSQDRRSSSRSMRDTNGNSNGNRNRNKNRRSISSSRSRSYSRSYSSSRRVQGQGQRRRDSRSHSRSRTYSCSPVKDKGSRGRRSRSRSRSRSYSRSRGRSVERRGGGGGKKSVGSSNSRSRRSRSRSRTGSRRRDKDSRSRDRDRDRDRSRDNVNGGGGKFQKKNINERRNNDNIEISKYQPPVSTNADMRVNRYQAPAVDNETEILKKAEARKILLESEWQRELVRREREATVEIQRKEREKERGKEKERDKVTFSRYNQNPESEVGVDAEGESEEGTAGIDTYEKYESYGGELSVPSEVSGIERESEGGVEVREEDNEAETNHGLEGEQVQVQGEVSSEKEKEWANSKGTDVEEEEDGQCDADAEVTSAVAAESSKVESAYGLQEVSTELDESRSAVSTVISSSSHAEDERKDDVSSSDLEGEEHSRFYSAGGHTAKRIRDVDGNRGQTEEGEEDCYADSIYALTHHHKDDHMDGGDNKRVRSNSVVALRS